MVAFFTSLGFIILLCGVLLVSHAKLIVVDNKQRPSVSDAVDNTCGPSISTYNNEYHTNTRRKRFASLFLVFLVTVIGIRNYQNFVPDQNVSFYWSFTSFSFAEDLVGKLFPDIVLFYGMIYLVAVIALVSEFYPNVRQRFHHRIDVEMQMGDVLRYSSSITVGEICCICAIFSVMLGQFCLFYFNHGWQNTPTSYWSTQERAARALGQVLNVCMGLLIMPISRNNIWSVVFGVSWEAMLRFHQYMGGIFGLLIACHCFTWWKVYSQQGFFPHDIFAVPQQFHPDDFTVPLAVFTSICMLCIFYPLCSQYIRRSNYDLFYIIHHFSIVIFFMMLWHATMGWYFVTGGMILYVVDHIIRLSGCVGTSVTVVKLSASGSSHITQLSYLVHKPYSEIYQKLFGYGNAPCKYTPLEHDIGQYCFINIPAISTIEWHPFTISSAPCVDKYTSHHIKNMGNNEWTGKLYALAKKYDDDDPSIRIDSSDYIDTQVFGESVTMEYESESVRNNREKKSITAVKRGKYSNLVVSIDGPYGIPIQLTKYTHILLVAGGIGVTPMHSYFKYLYTAMSQNAPQFQHIKKIRLLWSIRSVHDINMFKEMVSIYVMLYTIL